jgi:hypothetical protein
MDQCNTSNWTLQIKSLYKSLNLEKIYNTLPLYDIGVLENKLLYNYENEWLEKVNRLPKLPLYRNIKRNFRYKNYLTMNIPIFQRSFLAQLRCSILPISIETGR